MTPFDFDKVEQELDMRVPHVYRNFMTQVRDLGIVFEEWEFPNTAEELIALNKALKEAFSDIWKDNFIALLPDGCGNYFTLDAYSLDSDRMVIVAHDPYGIEDLGDGAQELFRGYLSKPKRKSKTA